LLELSGLAKTWPDGTQAVRGVDLAIDEAEFVVLLGPSGCGKTTTLRMIAGLEQPTAGRVALAGRDVTNLRPSERDIGFVFQFFALYPHMSVAENIGFPLECAGVARDERRAVVARLAERLGLVELLARKPRQLSGGDQQRVALARAMARKPALWLMDEPLGQLDAALRADMCEFLRAQQLEQRAATVYVTHDQDEALRLADRIVVMDGGSVLQVGAPHDVYDEPATLFVARFVGSPGMNLIHGDVRTRNGASSFHTRGDAGSIALARRAPDGEAVLGIRPERIRLDVGGSIRGRVVLDAFAGACRYQHVDTPFGRIAVRTSAQRAAREGEEARLALDDDAVRLFDAASGRRLA
jgi:multiple sugar transport system ATP-binding protein